jgi:hypothetical protein
MHTIDDQGPEREMSLIQTRGKIRRFGNGFLGGRGYDDEGGDVGLE